MTCKYVGMFGAEGAAQAHAALEQAGLVCPDFNPRSPTRATTRSQRGHSVLQCNTCVTGRAEIKTFLWEERVRNSLDLTKGKSTASHTDVELILKDAMAMASDFAFRKLKNTVLSCV